MPRAGGVEGGSRPVKREGRFGSVRGGGGLPPSEERRGAPSEGRRKRRNPFVILYAGPAFQNTAGHGMVNLVRDQRTKFTVCRRNQQPLLCTQVITSKIHHGQSFTTDFMETLRVCTSMEKLDGRTRLRGSCSTSLKSRPPLLFLLL